MATETPSNEWPVTDQWPVAWGDMDAFGHVNNTVYFRYFEHIRMACFARIGFIESMKATGIGPILAKTSCVFRRALSHPDSVEISTRISDVGIDRFTMHYRVFSIAQQAVAAQGEGRIICLDYAREVKVPLPDAVRAAIAGLQ
jgi:acyl-CoA thioester hydrolase